MIFLTRSLGICFPPCGTMHHRAETAYFGNILSQLSDNVPLKLIRNVVVIFLANWIRILQRPDMFIKIMR